ncbi:MAG: amino acid racemase [Gemmatimonadetes bacterium]|uniref:Amino acid racemase n=1 Tax=Candidatus Kutchimonas denitrificans TaxID=3056748 RepID=A0AAE4Z895_9BACT|nr:amino acid racemase [Gemmatimonadota bacterium]NIR75650.1 amino acid racemase [Candidatus Kutchimonas denitrificans]NIR99629.1 amino acid racemase [Gemmatimonadota bacterium]NIT65904.1 amino acid racemase [Gemmatimonadota bacterium]NIV22073.1 amino acid racemase [Gemmatimonadota bacterium]
MISPEGGAVAGLLGGIGPFATARYYEKIMAECMARCPGYPELVVVSLDFERFTKLEDAEDRGPYVEEILSGLRRLAAAGVDFAAMTANSPHVALERIRVRAPLPIVSIVDPVVREIGRLGARTVLLLGISATVRGRLYRAELEAVGAEVMIPDAPDQALLDSIVFDELARGRVRGSSRRRLLKLIRQCAADAVLLACTELPLLIQPGSTSIPLVDTMDLHVRAIVDRMASR